MKKEIERSGSLILGILDTLAHFRHSFIPQYHFVITRAEAKIKMTK
jgi:hypothetical protein